LNSIETPYADLNPELILDAIESQDFVCSGSLSALNSYENRVYQVGLEGAAPLIAKFYRPLRWSNEAILEEHQFALELSALEIPVIAPLEIKGNTLHEHQHFRFALFPCKGGRAFEVDNKEQLEQMGRFIARIHAVGSCKSFKYRPHLNVETYGYQPYHYLIKNNFIPFELKHNFATTIETALQCIDEQFKMMHEMQVIRLHGDFHRGNILCHTHALHIVDLDDCLMGPAIQDIWMMLCGSKSETEWQLKHIFDGYYEFHDFNLKELKLIEALRTLRMIHYAGWLAKRWTDPAFRLNFPWFNTSKYWETQLQHLREQLNLLYAED
jgi:Ser/Thr protein kinase RdoA (MazF antagonist)